MIKKNLSIVYYSDISRRLVLGMKVIYLQFALCFDDANELRRNQEKSAREIAISLALEHQQQLNQLWHNINKIRERQKVPEESFEEIENRSDAQLKTF